MNGALILSLDYELLWGIIEKKYALKYGQSNVKNVDYVISRLINIFDIYNVKATFATVGFVMCRDIEELTSFAPEQTPSYSNLLSPYGDYLRAINKENASLYFAPKTVEKLKKSPLIEIGTHTFCHYYCWEAGQTVQQFEMDLNAAIKLAKSKGIALTSIILPRNNVSEEYLKICYKNGIIAYRGNSKSFFSRTNSQLGHIKNRLLRFLDSYIPIGGLLTYKYEELVSGPELPVNIPASRMLRPYNPKIKLLETLRVRRIKKELIHAAKTGEMYHLWWHPHNFGNNVEENLSMLENIIRCYKECENHYGMKSYTMTEFAKKIIK